MKRTACITAAVIICFTNTLCIAASTVSASNWFMCFNEDGDKFIAWVDSSNQVTSVASQREGDAIPYFLTPMLVNPAGDRTQVLNVNPGYQIKRDNASVVVGWNMQFGVAELGCNHARDE